MSTTVDYLPVPGEPLLDLLLTEVDGPHQISVATRVTLGDLRTGLSWDRLADWQLEDGHLILRDGQRVQVCLPVPVEEISTRVAIEEVLQPSLRETLLPATPVNPRVADGQCWVSLLTVDGDLCRLVQMPPLALDLLAEEDTLTPELLQESSWRTLVESGLHCGTPEDPCLALFYLEDGLHPGETCHLLLDAPTLAALSAILQRERGRHL